MARLPHTERLRPGQAARLLGISERHLMNLANAGLINHERTPLGRLYDAADVERLRVEREAATA